MLFFLAAITTTLVKAEQSSLLAIAQDLHCTQSEKQAAHLLTQLFELPTQPFGIPNENTNAGQNAELYAATVDILLQVLYEITQRYPELQESAERVALLWNYCEIIDGSDLADLSSKKNEIEKKEAIGPFPAQKKGFGIWGFFSRNAENRYVPQILRPIAVYPRAYQDLLFRLTQQQCFPHPDLGNLQDSAKEHVYHGALHLSAALESGNKYPFTWQQNCESKSNKVVTKAILKKHPQPIKKIVVAQYKKNEVVAQQKPMAPSAISIDIPRRNTNVHLDSVPLPVINALPVTKPQAKFKAIPEPEKISTAEATKKTKHLKLILNLTVPEYVQPTKKECPTLSSAQPSGGYTAGEPLPLPPSNGLGLAGNFYNTIKLTGAMSLGASASWRPYSNFFVRAGANYTYLPNSGNLKYSWGIGYDDWHPGTFSAQLNNWGPIAFSDGLALDKAVANFGYKFKADFLKPYNLTGSAALNIPISGHPSLATTWVWTPKEHWFVRATLQTDLVDPNLSWSYGFGYSDWHPFTFSVVYNNWGPNPVLGANSGNGFNFVENGVVTAAWSWAF